jgi:cobalt-zinc-cadmium efflux system membrane fusion protein
MKPSNRIFILMFCASLFVAAGGCGKKNEEAAAPPEIERKGDTLVIPEKSPLREKLVFGAATNEQFEVRLPVPAVVEPDPSRFAKVFPPLAGRVAKLQVTLGENVTNRQLLATMDSPDFMAAQNDLIKAKSALAVAERALKRQKDLLEHKIAAEKDVEQAESDFAQANGEYDRATRKLNSFGLKITEESLGEPLQVFSPITGRVVDLTSALGEFRNDPNSPLMTVADLSDVWLTASVQEKDISQIKPGQEVEAVFAAYPTETFHGKVRSIGDLLDPDTRAIKVRVIIQNPEGRLRPGMFASVTFVGFTESSVVIPASSIVQIGESTFVFEQVRPFELQSREVAIGPQQGDRIVIKRGIAAGASIVVKGGVLLQ